jgi:hypothetical protein
MRNGFQQIIPRPYHFIFTPKMGQCRQSYGAKATILGGWPFQSARDRERLADGLRKAGLTEH